MPDPDTANSQEAKDYSFTGYRRTLCEAARELRKHMTPAETKLWNEFCRRSSWKFYRQRPIDRFIADFYCPAAKLVIELDGSPHFTEEGRQRDEIRTEILELYQLSVLRFTNDQVMRDFDWVCRTIQDVLDHRVMNQSED